MPAPKNTQELADLIDARKMNWFEELLNHDKDGFYDPIRDEIKLSSKLEQSEVKYTKIHEETHKFIPEVSENIKKQALKDFSLLTNKTSIPYLESALNKYPVDRHGKEILARFAETMPYEIMNPTTKTGLYLNRVFSEKLNWNDSPEKLIKDLETQLNKINPKYIKISSGEISKLFIRRFYDSVVSGIKQTYMTIKSRVYKENNLVPSYGLQDEQIVQQYTNSKLLWDSYADLNQELSNRINTIINSSYEGSTFNSNKAKKLILEQVPKLTKHRVNTILRTEYGNIQNIGAERSYREIDPENTGLYLFYGPTDNRNAESTREVKARQGRGLPLDELKALVKEVGMKYHPDTYDENRPWVLHINTRHRLLKVA